jgi:hypothetical protein
MTVKKFRKGTQDYADNLQMHIVPAPESRLRRSVALTRSSIARNLQLPDMMTI